MENYSWPEPIGDTFVTREMAHAVGVLNINWNWCEFTVDFMLSSLLELPPRVSKRITSNLGNVSKCDIIVGIAKEMDLSGELVAHVEHFVRCYDICRENRNLLVHGLCLEEYPDVESGAVFLGAKAKREITERAIPVTREILERICSETKALYWYAAEIFDHMRSAEHHTLPKKPRLPDKLTNTHPAQRV